MDLNSEQQRTEELRQVYAFIRCIKKLIAHNCMPSYTGNLIYDLNFMTKYAKRQENICTRSGVCTWSLVIENSGIIDIHNDT